MIKMSHLTQDQELKAEELNQKVILCTISKNSTYRLFYNSRVSHRKATKKWM